VLTVHTLVPIWKTKGREADIGGMKFLAKPVDLAELTRVVEMYLKR